MPFDFNASLLLAINLHFLKINFSTFCFVAAPFKSRKSNQTFFEHSTLVRAVPARVLSIVNPLCSFCVTNASENQSCYNNICQQLYRIGQAVQELFLDKLSKGTTG